LDKLLVGQTVCATVAQCEHDVRQLNRPFGQQSSCRSVHTMQLLHIGLVCQTVAHSVHTMRRFDKQSVQQWLTFGSNMFDTCDWTWDERATEEQTRRADSLSNRRNVWSLRATVCQTVCPTVA